MDRLFLGLFLSGLTLAGGLLLGWMAQARAISWDDVVLGFIGYAFFAMLVVFFVQLPVWSLLHLVRVPDWAGSPAAGAAAATPCAALFWVLSNHPPPLEPSGPGMLVYLIIGAIIGAIGGAVCWRAAKADVGL